MSYKITNIPTRQSGVGVVCRQTEHGDFCIADSNGWEICTLRASTPENLAAEIARVVQLARDAGFEQGRAFVRDALGVGR